MGEDTGTLINFEAAMAALKGDIGTATTEAAADHGQAVAATAAPTIDPRLAAIIAMTPMPDGFEIWPQGLMRLEVDCQGRVVPEHVCSAIYPYALSRNADGTGWSLVVAIIDLDGRVHDLLIPQSQLIGAFPTVLRRLLDHGLRFSSAREAKAFLRKFLLAATPKHRIRLVETCGWHGDKAYLLGTTAIGDCSGEDLRLKNAANANSQVKTSGTFEGWQALAALLLGNRRLMFAICVALSGALMGPTRTESGGVHYTGTSTHGKTTLCIIAGSVIGGGGDKGFVSEWRSTATAFECMLAAANDSVFIADEIGSGDAKDLGPITYLLANGQGKSRARSDGSMQPTKRWRVALISAGEMPIGERIREGGGVVRAGMELRIIDVPADAGKEMGTFEDLHGFLSTREFATHLATEATTHYGWAMPRFVAGIAEDLEAVTAYVREVQGHFAAAYVPAGSDGQVLRVAARIALAAAAGELATAMGILPWPDGAATDAAATCFAAWLGHRGGTEDGATVRGVKELLATLAQVGMNRFAPWGDITEQADLLGWRKQNAEGGWEFYAATDGFGELIDGYDRKAMVGALKARGILVPDANGEVSPNTKVPGVGQRRLYRLRLVEGDAADE